ncbi:MAG TPA: class I adenylate-forming enzyme family protein [Usitatibacter sp.]
MTERVPLLLDRIREAIARDPEAPAFLGAAPISYGAMRALVSNTMRALDGQGIRAGQVVALTMSQSPMHIITFLALARLGVISLSVSPIPLDADRAALYRRFGVTAVVSELANAGAPGVLLIHLQGMGAKGTETEFDTWSYEPVGATPLRIALTSGTVGEQKGIEQSHEDFARRLDRRHYGEAERPRVLPPNLHVTAALSLACHALTRGGTVVFPPGYDAASLTATIQRFDVTTLTFPPAHIAMMLPTLPENGPAFPTVTHFRLMSTAPSAAFLEELRRKVTPHVFVPYSTTETGVIAIATPELLEKEPGCAGRIVPDAELEVIGEGGRVLPPNTPGEIRVRTPGMPRGYFGNADATRFRDGWFHPRDTGYVTEEGVVYIQGRIDEVINVGGRKLAPRHAEAILEEDPAVREAAVFPLDAMTVGAIIAAKGPIDWTHLDEFARTRLEVFAPVRYYEVAELPRNPLGKIRRPELPALAVSAGATLRHPAQ